MRTERGSRGAAEGQPRGSRGQHSPIEIVSPNKQVPDRVDIQSRPSQAFKHWMDFWFCFVSRRPSKRQEGGGGGAAGSNYTTVRDKGLILGFLSGDMFTHPPPSPLSSAPHKEMSLGVTLTSPESTYLKVVSPETQQLGKFRLRS